MSDIILYKERVTQASYNLESIITTMASFLKCEANVDPDHYFTFPDITLPMYDDLQTLVLGNPNNPKNIVLVGEGDNVFTLSLALSILRESPNGIDVVSTVNQPDIRAVKNKAGNNCPLHIDEIAIADEVCANAHRIANLRNSNMPNVKNKVVWLECPEYWDDHAGEHITIFMNKITDYQEYGDYLIIKIYPSFFPDPMLWLHYMWTIAAMEIGYWLCGCDEWLIKDIIEYGGYEETQGQCQLLMFIKKPVATLKDNYLSDEASCSYPIPVPSGCIDETLMQHDAKTMHHDTLDLVDC